MASHGRVRARSNERGYVGGIQNANWGPKTLGNGQLGMFFERSRRESRRRHVYFFSQPHTAATYTKIDLNTIEALYIEPIPSPFNKVLLNLSSCQFDCGCTSLHHANLHRFQIQAPYIFWLSCLDLPMMLPYEAWQHLLTLH